jgi:hypothetical protein
MSFSPFQIPKEFIAHKPQIEQQINTVYNALSALATAGTEHTANNIISFLLMHFSQSTQHKNTSAEHQANALTKALYSTQRYLKLINLHPFLNKFTSQIHQKYGETAGLEFFMLNSIFSLSSFSTDTFSQFKKHMQYFNHLLDNLDAITNRNAKPSFYNTLFSCYIDILEQKKPVNTLNSLLRALKKQINTEKTDHTESPVSVLMTANGLFPAAAPPDEDPIKPVLIISTIN